MHTLSHPSSTKWVVSHNNVDVFHASEVSPNNCLITGQPFMEVFDSKEEMLSQFPQLANEEDLLQDNE